MLRSQKTLAVVLAITGGLATVGAVYQTYQVSELRRQLDAAAREKAGRSVIPIPVEDQSTPKFVETVRKTIPDIFWGEFAEDVHDCGTPQSFVVTDRKLMVKEDKQETIERVQWAKPKLIALTTMGNDFLEHSFEMELSPDNNEITFIFTNMKVIRQRCSARAHEEPGESLVEDANMDAPVDMNATPSDY